MSLSEALTEAIRLEGKRSYHPSENFRMSSFGHCVRKQVAMRAGIEPVSPADARGLLKMWMGTSLHKAMQAKLEACGFLEPSWTEREVRYRSYVGHVDGLTRKLTGTDEYGPALVEIKSSSDDAVAKYGWPEHYEWQNLLCVRAVELKRGLLYQVGRENGLDREKIVLLTEDWKVKIDQEISLVESGWEVYKTTGNLPSCIHRFGWEDRTCPYREGRKKKEAPEKPVNPNDWNPFKQTEHEKELAGWLDKQEETK